MRKESNYENKRKKKPVELTTDFPLDFNLVL